MRSPFFLLLIFLPLMSHAALDADQDDMKQRIKPIGRVHTTGTSQQAPVAKATAPVALDPQTIYDQHCIICHRDGVAGAPKFRDEATWNPRLANQTIDDLVAFAIKGKNAMPPKGTCQECSDSDIKAVIKFMIPQK